MKRPLFVLAMVVCMAMALGTSVSAQPENTGATVTSAPSAQASVVLPELLTGVCPAPQEAAITVVLLPETAINCNNPCTSHAFCVACVGAGAVCAGGHCQF